jgi:transcriptional regulator with XRE-family HTH domain
MTMTATAATLLDLVIDKLDLKNDAGLARELDLSPPAISKMRNGKLPVGAVTLVRMHEATGMTIGQLRECMGLPPRMYIQS